MLIGAHVSPAGGPARAVERGDARGCQAVQIFNQNPRAWKPREYSGEELAAYREARAAASSVQVLLIHAVYLLNCASTDREIAAKSRVSLTAALDAGAALGAAGVVLHPGSALVGGGPADEAVRRAGSLIREALSDAAPGCALHLENTAGAGGTLGRSFEELASLLEACGDSERVGVCLDSCHLYASGYDVRTASGLSDVLDRFDEVVGLSRLGSLHLNDSAVGLASNRDRHANLGAGELGREGCAAWLSEPRFDGLPCVMETEGTSGGKGPESGPSAEDIALARTLRDEGMAARAG